MRGRHGRHAKPGHVPQAPRGAAARPDDAPPPSQRPTSPQPTSYDEDDDDKDPLLDAASKLL